MKVFVDVWLKRVWLCKSKDFEALIPKSQSLSTPYLVVFPNLVVLPQSSLLVSGMRTQELFYRYTELYTAFKNKNKYAATLSTAP